MLQKKCTQRDTRFAMRPLSRVVAQLFAVGLATSTVVGCNSDNDDIQLSQSDNANSVVSQLVEEMSLEEKVAMLHGTSDPLAGAGAIVGNDRLAIPTLLLTDGPAGARNANYLATAMPAPVALAASFDKELAGQFGTVIGKEARAQQQDVLLSPMTNIVRVPQAGRNFETLGEDPVLAGDLVAAEIEGVQGAGLMATVKHYVANNQETNRGGIDTIISERALREIYLPAFKKAVDAGVASFMCSYNRINIDGENSQPACANEETLNGILKGEWGFDGFVMTDWGAIRNGAREGDVSPAVITKGLDLEMPRANMLGDTLIEAVQAGDIDESYVDGAVSRILTQMERFGLLDNSAPARGSIEALADEHAEIAKQAALKGAVLLRNENSALPLDSNDLANLLVVGPTGAVLNFGGGGSSRVKALSKTSPLAALEELAGDGANISYLPGIDLDGVVVPTSALTDGSGNAGLARVDAGGTTQLDEQINFVGDDELPAGSSFTWTGELTAPETGEYDIKLQVQNAAATLSVNDGALVSLNTSSPFDSQNSVITTRDGLENSSTRVTLTAGETYTVTVTATAGSVGSFSSELADEDGPMQVRMAWETPSQRQANLEAAIAAAASASAVVVFGYNEGTEGQDRDSLALPYDQDELIGSLAKANGNTVVVLNTGDPVTMPWVDDTAAILETWYSGQEGGEATAELLLGEANPSGKLPVTFPRREDDLPAVNPENFPGVNGELYFDEGIYVGYRWYDSQNIEPLFPFGHGLSYTSFSYTDPTVTSSANGYSVTFTVTNTGPVDGTAVPQVYVGEPATPIVEVPEKVLVGFDRVALAAGESASVTVPFDSQALHYWSTTDDAWKWLPGQRPVYLGHSSRDYRFAGTITVAQ